MADSKRFTRREFTISSAMAVLSGVAVTVAGCGGSSSSSTTSATPLSDVEGVIVSNHGHAAVVTGTQLGAGNTITLNIQGSSNHPHSVELTGADLSQIQAGARVTKTSTPAGSHTHRVTFN